MISKSLWICLVLAVSLYCSSSDLSVRKAVDWSIAIVNGTHLLESDFIEPRLDRDGIAISLDDFINEELMVQKALEYKITVSPSEIESRAALLKRANNMSDCNDESWDEWLRKASLSKRRVDRQFYRTGMVARLKATVLPDNNVVSDKKVQEYYDANPDYVEEAYELQAAFLTEKDAEKLVKGRSGVKMDWIGLGKVEKTQLSDKMSFVSRMPEGAVAKPFKGEAGYQVVKMVKKIPRRLKDMEECRAAIEKQLYASEKQRRFDEYLEILRGEASIVRL